MSAKRNLSLLRDPLLGIMSPLAGLLSFFSYLLGIYHEESVQSLVLEEFLHGLTVVPVGYLAEDVR